MRRVLSAAVVAALTLGLCLLAPPWARASAILLAALYACREAVRLAGAVSAPDDGGPPRWGLAATVVLMLVVVIPLTAGAAVPGGGSAAPLLSMALLGVFALILPTAPRALGWLGAIALAALWIGLPAGALLALNAGDGGGRILLFLLATVMIGEAGALGAGKLIGGPRLAPTLSPGKTWAGFSAQLVFGAAAGAAFGPLLAGASAAPGPVAGALLGAWISLAAALGDLFESFWKRSAGQKDSGRIIPGHGGLLDRIDGVLFGALALRAATLVAPL